MTPSTTALDAPPAPMDPRIKARRIEVRRSEGRRRLQRLADAGMLAVVALAFAGALYTPLLDVDAVDVSGALRSTPATVRATLGVERGEPLVGVDLGTAAARVAALPWVEEVQIHRGLDGVVEVQVTERIPVALVAGDGADLLVDRTGRVLGPVAQAAPGSGPLVRVLGLGATPAPGRWLPARSADVLAVAAHLATTVPGAVDRLDAGGGDLVAGLVAGGEVRFGDAAQLDAKVQSLVTMLEQVDLTCLAVLDLRLPGTPVLTRDEPCS